MPQLRIDSRGQRLFQTFDSFRDFAKPFGVLLRIPSTFFVTDNHETIAKSCGKLD
ncbi:MAG TPA: hypothetical protein VE086_08530 [Chthoniobacterales bacterium]|nr:hypothetical protein [Chthoniobacterales bacterium]